ncbi:hypothetical protein [Streptomyces sp. AP-93]|uniref:hypothetical protein n=1 Tax=Streptomyces sp. AP-93 TaxID=2929048 RepID=UPI001FAE804B|nr:hypothetical protein [Streptomyces sp. AP-93]MCJ0872267.1 hypothetical protein [Streptomyces sp. AP-93]
MPTYENVMNAPLGPLQTAITDWAAMVKKLDELAESARNGMKAKSDTAQWNGVTAGVARPLVDKTAKEFDDAAREAKGIHLLLSDGHSTLKAVQEQIKKLVADAPAAGFRIDESGRVSAIPLADAQDRYAAQHDPDYQASLRKNQGLWQDRVDRAVEDAQDADDSLVRALQANVTDDNNFTAPKYGTLDAEQADRAAALMKQVAGAGGTARHPEALRELEDLLDDNREDPEFATGFYRTVGAEGTLEMYATMSLDATSLGVAGRDRALIVANIQSDMGAMLGLATHKDVPNHLDAAWTTQLMKAGRKEMQVTGGVTTIYGYQALGALIREGTYDKEFLTSVGRDMVAMDRKDPKAWEYHTPYGLDSVLNQGEGGGRGFYPLTGLMEALGNNPDAATAFFNEPVREDSNGDGIVTKDDEPVGGQHGKDQGMVDYMLDKKPYADGFDMAKAGDPHAAQEALGGALEAAVSGRAAGDEDAKPVPHTGPMTDVMERVVEKISDNPELVAKPTADEPTALGGLSGNFGRMAAEYMPDLQATAANSTQEIKTFGEQADFKKSDMARFLGVVAQDPEAYGVITTAQQTHTTALVSDVIAHRADHSQLDTAIANAVNPGGQIAGMLSEARAQGTYGAAAHANEEYVKGVEDSAKWVNRGITMAGGKYLELVPLAGDVVEWLQEDITEAIVDSAKEDVAEKTGKTEKGVMANYADAEASASKAAAAAVANAARGSDMTATDIDDLKLGASRETGTAHSTGRNLMASGKAGS